MRFKSASAKSRPKAIGHVRSFVGFNRPARIGKPAAIGFVRAWCGATASTMATGLRDFVLALFSRWVVEHRQGAQGGMKSRPARDVALADNVTAMREQRDSPRPPKQSPSASYGFLRASYEFLCDFYALSMAFLCDFYIELEPALARKRPFSRGISRPQASRNKIRVRRTSVRPAGSDRLEVQSQKKPSWVDPSRGDPGSIVGRSWVPLGSVLAPSWIDPGSVLGSSLGIHRTCQRIY